MSVGFAKQGSGNWLGHQIYHLLQGFVTRATDEYFPYLWLIGLSPQACSATRSKPCPPSQLGGALPAIELACRAL